MRFEPITHFLLLPTHLINSEYNEKKVTITTMQLAKLNGTPENPCWHVAPSTIVQISSNRIQPMLWSVEFTYIDGRECTDIFIVGSECSSCTANKLTKLIYLSTYTSARVTSFRLKITTNTSPPTLSQTSCEDKESMH